MKTWQKLGLVITPMGYPWAMSHAQNPAAEHREGSVYRVYFSPRDERNRAGAAWADIDVEHPERGMLDHSRQSLLELGRPGAFDDCGVMPHCVVEAGGAHHMFYTGWSLAKVVPFTFFIGLARSHDGGKTFGRVSEAPVLGRNRHDPFLTAAPWVILENGLWRMWYISGSHWELVEGDQPKHYYRIKYAESDDGETWRPVAVAVDFEDDEYAIARPVVTRTARGYEMWFCSRGGDGTYRPRHATSPDGLDWTRTPGDTGIDVSESGWDSDMVCYPFVFSHGDKQYMLYNGNGYGRDGAGLAVRDLG